MNISEIANRVGSTEEKVEAYLKSIGSEAKFVTESMISDLREEIDKRSSLNVGKGQIASTTAQPKANLDRATRPAQKPIPKTDRVTSQPTTKLAQVARNLDQDFTEQRVNIRGAVYDIATTRADELADALGDAPNIYNRRLEQRLEEGVYDRDSFRQGTTSLVEAFNSGFAGGGMVEPGSEPTA